MVKESPSEALVVIGDGSDFGIGGAGGELQDSLEPAKSNLLLRG